MLAGAAIVPVVVVGLAIGRPAHKADLYYERWPEEPELAGYLVDRTVHGPGGVFRGSSLFWKSDYGIQLTLANLWVRGVPSTSEYSQLITPQSTYFASKVLNNDVRDLLNLFLPRVEASSATSLKILPMLGTRYYIVSDQSDPVATRLDALARAVGSPSVSVPQGVHHRADKGARWNVYELPQPNLGNYSPTEVTTAESGAAAAALMNAAEFDFTRQAVLSAPLQKTLTLTPARNMRMSFVRGGLHLSGRSDGTSLVVLPQQFTHCLRARDRRVRLVRANIMLTGVIFEGSIDTDILFDYGVFTPRCRRADLADIKALELHIDTPASRPSGGRLFPGAGDAIAKLWVAFSALK